MSRKPVVGITLGDDDRQAGILELREAYACSVERAGGIPVALPPLPDSDAEALLERLDGLLLSGGIDVDPELYGVRPEEGLRRVDRRRDDFELALTRQAIRNDLPILAICRGHQLLNVATGGTLHQHLPSLVAGGVRHERAEPRAQRVHAVDVREGTRLASLLGKGLISVNSIHHQAVARVGRDLVVSARCPEDDVVEGIEMPGRRFVLGVQWHPESFWQATNSFQCLFDAHAEACRARALAESR